MDFYTIANLFFYVVLAVLLLSSLGLAIVLFLYFSRRSRIRRKSRKSRTPTIRSSPIQTVPSVFWNDGNDDDEDDITTYRTQDIPASGLFSATERQAEYRRRGKSPSGVIDGIYNDMNRENGRPYSDMDRDWDADA